MKAMWAGRFQKELSAEVNDFNSSIPFDARMYRQDIEGSLAHAAMLAAKGILTGAEAAAIAEGLAGIREDLDSGALAIDPEAEDIHMFVEAELTRRIGDAGKKLHTARSRNDQVALDLRLYLLSETDAIRGLTRRLLGTILMQAEAHAETAMPGYTHLQRAQPVTFGHHLMAYANMFWRDLDRLADCEKRMRVSPLGSCALAGTTFSTDRQQTAAALGLSGACENSMDGVSDRDFVLELAACLAVMMMHLSRFSEEIVLWCSWEFRFVELDDAYATGSSIMPQKKNPDIAELVRGKAGRAYGDLMALLTMMKGLPLAYNKDMQEDKEAIFDSVDTVRQCLCSSRCFPPCACARTICAVRRPPGSSTRRIAPITWPREACRSARRIASPASLWPIALRPARRWKRCRLRFTGGLRRSLTRTYTKRSTWTPVCGGGSRSAGRRPRPCARRSPP